jgi:prolyl 4-hydroxylase
MPAAAVAQARQLAAAGRGSDGATLLARAGDGDALFELARWQLFGGAIPRDLAAARATLRRAVAAGQGEAARMEVALAATGGGAAPNWSGALALLRTAAARDPLAAADLALVEAMALTPAGDPQALPGPEVLSAAPAVRRMPALLTAEECRHVAALALPLLAPATVVDPATGRNVVNPVRTSDTAVVGPFAESLTLAAINRRIAAASGTDWRQGEALTVLRYRPGQQFRPHLDAIAGARNQRVRTVLVYLNDGYGGGATTFAGGLSVAPRTGDAVIFDNVRADGGIDQGAQHAGAIVTRGEKWLATRWIRARPFDPWAGGPEAF